MRPRQKYTIIRKLHRNIELLCSIAKVSRSGYYAWLKSADDPDRDHEDHVLIKKIFEQGKRKLGFRQIQMKLKANQIIMNHKKIIRIKQKYGLFTKVRRRNPYKMIAKKSMEHRTFPNILERKFVQHIPKKVLCTDITYVPFNRRMAYLSVIKDIASREILAWRLSLHIDMDLVMDTLAVLRRGGVSLEGAIIHSDQGFHYTNPLYISIVADMKMTQSMSRKGNCIDNAAMETFFGHLKDDIDYKNCKTFDELKQLITDYMYYYNNERYQWSIKKMTPIEYRSHLLAAVAA